MDQTHELNKLREMMTTRKTMRKDQVNVLLTYDWTCPMCNMINLEIDSPNMVTHYSCHECGNIVKLVDPPLEEAFAAGGQSFIIRSSHHGEEEG